MAVTPFIEDRLPIDVERGAKGGPEFSTTVLSLDSGFEQRNSNWSLPRGSWDLSYGISKITDLEAVRSLFYACRGKLTGFRFKDWSDYKITGQQIGTGDGTTKIFQIYKRYTTAGTGTYFDRPIKKPVQGTLTLRLNGTVTTTGFTVDYTKGLITFTVAPTAGVQIGLDVQFDVPVRFDVDKLEEAVEIDGVMSIDSLTIIELKQL